MDGTVVSREALIVDYDGIQKWQQDQQIVQTFSLVRDQPNLIFAAYGAYIFHVLIVVGIKAGIQSLIFPPILKFLFVFVIGAILSFGISFAFRHVPGATKIL